jgi:hypothetical protein
MLRSGRPLLYDPRFVQGFRAALMQARADLREMHETQRQHLCDLAELRGQVTALHEVVELVVMALRQQAEVDVSTLRRQLELALACIERDPKRLLN